jgi:methylthioribulose-1-phosphate dehydratase
VTTRDPAAPATANFDASTRGGMSDAETKDLLCSLLRAYYDRNWVAGTGGGICGPTEDGNLFLAPTGVHKELVQPRDFFVVRPDDGSVVRPPDDPALRPSECGPIFCAAARIRGAGSSMHSHGLIAVLAADLARDTGADHIEIRDLEMLKGIRGGTNEDIHLVPVIRNTPRERELVAQVEAALRDPRFQQSFAILVADHGAYIWGADVWETKRHAEVYHFLFEAILARHSGRPAATSHHRSHEENRA